MAAPSGYGSVNNTGRDAPRPGGRNVASTKCRRDSFHISKKLTAAGPDERCVPGGNVCLAAGHISHWQYPGRPSVKRNSCGPQVFNTDESHFLPNPNIGPEHRALLAGSRDVPHGLAHHSSNDRMLGRLAGDASIEPLKVLADVLEPANLGQRMKAQKYTQQTPLNRLVDAAPPESATAREFAALVARMDQDAIRGWLGLWRDNDAKLAPTIAKSFLLEEDAPLSKDLSRMGSIGLEALDYLQRGRRPPEKWLREQRGFLFQAGKLRLELRIAVTPSIQKLAEAAASR
jgi:hypothetical protein